MKTILSRPVVLFCVFAALLFASCKKNMETTPANGDQPVASGEKQPLALPGAFKKEIKIKDEGGATYRVTISSNDEQAVNSFTKSQFRVAPESERIAFERQNNTVQPPRNAEIKQADLSKAVYISFSNEAGNTSRSALFNLIINRQAGLINPVGLFSDVDPGNPIMFRRNALASVNDFGVCYHTKVIGLAFEHFGAPWGTTGYPLRTAITSQTGVLCNRLITWVNLLSVNNQQFSFLTQSWS